MSNANCSEPKEIRRPKSETRNKPEIRMRGRAVAQISNPMPLGFEHPHPGGLVDNSPTFQFQRWVGELRVWEVPKGRLKLRDSSAVPHSALMLFPKVETLGYYRVSFLEK